MSRLQRTVLRSHIVMVLCGLWVYRCMTRKAELYFLCSQLCIRRTVNIAHEKRIRLFFFAAFCKWKVGSCFEMYASHCSMAAVP